MLKKGLAKYLHVARAFGARVNAEDTAWKANEAPRDRRPFPAAVPISNGNPHATKINARIVHLAAKQGVSPGDITVLIAEPLCTREGSAAGASCSIFPDLLSEGLDNKYA